MPGKHLDVYYHGKQVGTLAETPEKNIAFQYTHDWLKEGFSISPFSLPLRDNVFVPKDKNRELFDGLYGVFSDSLPDNWGRLLLDKYLLSHGINAADLSALDKLAYIGASGMGALEYHPSKEKDFNIDTKGLNYDEIAGECNKILSSKSSDRLDLLYNLGGSSGGTRPKILLSEAGKEWIIKFPASKDPKICGIREYDYSVCAKKSGINMTETRLIPSDICDGYFCTERFDRKSGLKIMTLTFAGALEADFRAPSCDYAIFMKMVSAFTKDCDEDKKQMYRVMCFNILTHNRDDHTKNFSFLYTEDKGWRLAPAYDLTYSDTYFGEHTTSVNGKGKDIAKDDLIKVGMDAGLKKDYCIECLEEIQTGVRDLEKYSVKPKRGRGEKIPVSVRLSDMIENLPLKV